MGKAIFLDEEGRTTGFWKIELPEVREGVKLERTPTVWDSAIQEYIQGSQQNHPGFFPKYLLGPPLES